MRSAAAIVCRGTRTLKMAPCRMVIESLLAVLEGVGGKVAVFYELRPAPKYAEPS